MSKELNTWFNHCLQCQKCKVLRHTKSPVLQSPFHRARFEHIHMDSVGPLSHHRKIVVIFWLLSIVFLVSLRLLLWEILASIKTRVPIKITSNQGTQSTSELLTELMKLLGSHQIISCPYNQQANGMLERFHWQLKVTITARGNTINWFDEFEIYL